MDSLTLWNGGEEVQPDQYSQGFGTQKLVGEDWMPDGLTSEYHQKDYMVGDNSLG